ncbi:hypothetical protein VMCG_09740 [Cytospora schulzeri]|uniref:rRNA adenine N(6)-methyltransferase n=1 Tax=Cytospora schulzeri TaxID=448051 RepID=A0A423VHG9_9PEZI|nr:hypothetical protein VMCG_09740 [Valsa malicola]
MPTAGEQLPRRGNGRALFLSLLPPTRLNAANSVLPQRRWRSWNDKSRGSPGNGDYDAVTPLAKQLQDTDVFTTAAARRVTRLKKEKALKKAEEDKLKVPKRRGRPKKIVEIKVEEKEEEKERPTGDRTRVNIVDEKLVDDVINYLKPSLERHKGCDLISIYPGAGLFTNALHDVLKPRSHLLLEPDEALYTPFLKPTLKDKGSRLIPKSGIVWQDLAEVLTPEYLPHQKEVDRKNLKEPPPRNDTLLVSMNLAMHPKRKYMLFDSMSRMVIYQLLSSLRTSTLFQKYGQVRMLIWVPDDEKLGLLPRTIQQRKKLAIEGELTTEYISEVCGSDSTLDEEETETKTRGTRLRPKQMELESMRLTLNRMKEGGFVTPEGRETRMMRLFLESGRPLDKPVPLTEEEAIYEKSFHKELEVLREQYKQGVFTTKDPIYPRFRMLRAYSNWLEKRASRLLQFTRKYEEVWEAYGKALEAKAKGWKTAEKLMERAKQLNEAYNVACDALPEYMLAQVKLMQDQLHSLQQPEHLGPLMMWDRRPYEPLPVKATDFFPNLACTLLDFQPKAMHPGLRAIGPGTNNAGDIFDMILGVVLQSVREPIPELLDQVWPGTSEGIVPLCPKLTDPEQGGSPLFGEATVGSRAANEGQLLQVLEEFMKWPFRPSYPELVGRLADEKLIDETSIMSEDGTGSLMGNNTMDAF